MKNCGTQSLQTPIQEETISKQKVDEELFLTSSSAVNYLLAIAENHARTCTSPLRIMKIGRNGHMAHTKLSCRRLGAGKHQKWWHSSPRLPDGQYLANQRILHGFSTSGILSSVYERFSEAAGIGTLHYRVRNNYFKTHLDPILEEEYMDSVSEALEEEIQQTLYEGPDTMERSIDIVTDARHGWRKNAKDSSVVAVEDKTHKVLQHIHITKSDDAVTQRHEKLGTMRIYENLSEEDVYVRVHAHDRNMAVNKYIKDRKDTVNQNDPWHTIKTLKKAITQIGHGTKKSKGTSWHEELEDKAESMGTHAYYAIKNCNKNPERMRLILLNAVQHYKNNHINCETHSRCRMDPNYESSRIVITSLVAENLLTNAIQKSTLYKSAQDYVYGKDTYYVESFNNTMNMFQDKRITFGNEEYKARSFLAVLHWNENVDRQHTSERRTANGKVKKKY